MNHIFQDTINQITVCLRFAMKFLSPAVLISSGKLHEFMMADFKDNFGFINFNGNGWMFEWQKDAIKPDQWHHLCYNFVDNMIQVVIDGISYEHEDMKGVMEDWPPASSVDSPVLACRPGHWTPVPTSPPSVSPAGSLFSVSESGETG